MGYSTFFDLDVFDQNEKIIDDPEDQVAYLKSISEDARYALNDDGSGCEQAKWYDFFKDMKKLSLNYPDLLFRLHCDGEEGEDFSHEWFFRGKHVCKTAEIVYPQLDFKNDFADVLKTGKKRAWNP